MSNPRAVGGDPRPRWHLQSRSRQVSHSPCVPVDIPRTVWEETPHGRSIRWQAAAHRSRPSTSFRALHARISTLHSLVQPVSIVGGPVADGGNLTRLFMSLVLIPPRSPPPEEIDRPCVQLVRLGNLD